ncbi:hypothetical protein [Arthrobacter sp. FW306-04-A]
MRDPLMVLLGGSIVWVIVLAIVWSILRDEVLRRYRLRLGAALEG